MSWHKTLAERSFLTGRKSADFKAAAQRHANAFWFIAIAAGVVWWLWGWKWALLPGALAVWTAFQSVSATLIQGHMERIEADIEGVPRQRQA